MTETGTEVETVTVTFEELKANVDHYLQVRKTKRLVITHGGEEILVLGPWLPGEERTPAPKWFMSELYAPPIYPDDPEFTEKLCAYLRGEDPST